MSLIKEDKAPRPKKRSFSRSVYDAIYSNAGPSTIEEIIQLIPATDDASKWQAQTPKRVETVLKSAEQHGYVQFNQNTERWGIATRTWYENMQAHLKEMRDKPLAALKQGPWVQTPMVAPTFSFTPRVVVWAVVVGWAAGVLTALAFVGLRAIGGV